MKKDEHVKAKRWREKHGMSTKELAERTGFSLRAIQKFELGISRGVTGTEEYPIPEESWQRYRMICAGVERELGGWKFNW